jgi:hypothetical protein
MEVWAQAGPPASAFQVAGTTGMPPPALAQLQSLFFVSNLDSVYEKVVIIF